MKMLLFLVPALALSIVFEKKELRFENGQTLEVEIADNMMKRNQGFMNRTSVGKNQGMLFIFDVPQKLSFWMKNTYIPLSIAYIDKNKVIKEIHQMEPQNMMEKVQDLKGYPSQCECKFALEVNQGWFKKNNVKVGHKFSLAKLSEKKK